MYKLKTYEAPMGRIARWVDFEDTAIGTTLFNTEADAIELMKSTIAQCQCPIKLKVVKCRNKEEAVSQAKNYGGVEKEEAGFIRRCGLLMQRG